jgi:uncharacterized protein with HEPN domain
MSREWLFYIDDMIAFSEKMLSYTKKLDQTEFELNSLVYDATLRNLELIGEAATHIPSEIRITYSHISWRQIIALRNRLIHAYLGLDNDVLWSIIQTDIPELLLALKQLKHSENHIELR